MEKFLESGCLKIPKNAMMKAHRINMFDKIIFSNSNLVVEKLLLKYPTEKDIFGQAYTRTRLIGNFHQFNFSFAKNIKTYFLKILFLKIAFFREKAFFQHINRMKSLIKQKKSKENVKSFCNDFCAILK